MSNLQPLMARFWGGIINTREFPTELADLEVYLLEAVLPAIRRMGWYGIGCFDVLADEHDRLYFIDANFRMTGMSAYHFMINDGRLREPIIGMNAEFKGSEADFKRQLLPLAARKSKQKFMQLIALTRYGQSWSFNAALTFSDEADLARKITTLRNAGISSSVFDLLDFKFH